MEAFSSASGSSRRARAPTSGSQVVSCLVDGCKSDLSKCRDYHRRHKVCEMHSKTPKVSIGGQEQRFCQQCSRFHPLGEFDEGKRSCRKRLEGHNRRRRKPQPESLPVKPGNFLSTARGSMFLQFSNSPLVPASSVVGSTWSEPTKPKGGSAMYSCQSQPGDNPPYSNHPFRSRQFPFVQGSSSSSTPTHPNDFANGWLNQGIDSALSLLSSSLAPTSTVHPNPVRAPSLVAGFHHAGLDHVPNPCPVPSQDGFQAGSDGSRSTNGHQQTVSFLWE